MSQPEFTSPEKMKRRQRLIVVVAVVTVSAVMLAAVYMQDPGRRAHAAASDNSGRRVVVETDFASPTKAINPEEAWIRRSESALAEMRGEIAALKEANRKLKEEIGKSSQPHQADESASLISDGTLREGPVNEAIAAGELPPLPEPPAPTKALGDASDGPLQGQATAVGGIVPTMPSSQAPQKIVKVEFKRPDPRQERKHIRDTLPVASFTKVVLLHGADAPTGGAANSNPLPIVMQAIDNGNLPNGFRHKVQSCRFLAAAYGELADERMHARLERFSCVLRTGEIVSVKVSGYLVGEDGKEGLVGKVLDKQGALIGRSLLAGVFSGLGKAISQTYTSVQSSPLGTVGTIDPERVLEYGGAQGVGSALDRIAQWYLDRANEVFPVISVNGGRTVSVVLTEDADLNVNLGEKHANVEE